MSFFNQRGSHLLKKDNGTLIDLSFRSGALGVDRVFYANSPIATLKPFAVATLEFGGFAAFIGNCCR